MSATDEQRALVRDNVRFLREPEGSALRAVLADSEELTALRTREAAFREGLRRIKSIHLGRVTSPLRAAEDMQRIAAQVLAAHPPQEPETPTTQGDE